MTIYAYVHNTEKPVLATTYDIKYVPEGISALEFPDGTPLILNSGVIEPQYTVLLLKAAAAKLQKLRLETTQTIERGFEWNGHQITLNKTDQANNQHSLVMASHAQLSATQWAPRTPVEATTIIAASGTHWRAVKTGITGSVEPNWINDSVSDGSAVWQKLQFSVGTVEGNFRATVNEMLEIGLTETSFRNAEREKYQEAKAKIAAITSLPAWAPGVSYVKGQEIFIPYTGAVWKATSKGKSGSVQPTFTPTESVVPDGTTAWSYVSQAEALVNAVSL